MKIYARKVPCEKQISPLDYSNFPDNVFVFGNDFCDRYGGGIIQELEDMLLDASDALAIGFDEEWGFDAVKRVVEEMLPAPDRKGEYTDKEICHWQDILADLYSGEMHLSDAVTEAMTIIDGINYAFAEIRGCSQGEWANVIYPARLGCGWLRMFETEFFNTGDEWRVSESEEDMCGEYFYTHRWSESGIVEEIAEEYGYRPDEVILICK